MESCVHSAGLTSGPVVQWHHRARALDYKSRNEVRAVLTH